MAKSVDLMGSTADRVDLGPFNPPAGYEFEEELQGEPPRPRTPELSTGRHAVGRRKLISGTLIAAAICTAISPWPFIQECGLYILPLQYLYWIGFGLGVAAIGQFLLDRVVPGRYRYVEDGIPLIARIRSVELRITQVIHGTPIYRFYSLLEYRHPESGELRQVQTSTRQISQFDVSTGLRTSYRVGDYVTAVYLPGKLEKSLRLYGFLELKPGLGLIKDSEAEVWKPRYIALLMAIGFGALFLPLWVLYIFGKFWPLDGDPSMAVPVVGGAVLLGGGYLAWQSARKRRERAERTDSGRPGFFRIFRGWLGTLVPLSLGGLVMFCGCVAVNAAFDASPPIHRPVEIDGMVSVTHHAIFREYKINYHFLDGDREHKVYVSTPAEMAQFRGGRAIAEIHVGRLGWSWVKALLPTLKLP